ncbi:hypothetical protein RN001_008425 [Aquatica leii]|uniref:Uncharacterized protein n=1 Tax=Aquatica leii TaxID=1421715 RepID=A0AAN7PXC9_9COLE|nr:hypothetical protein RN001_008425 [Aquatica leii]
MGSTAQTYEPVLREKTNRNAKNAGNKIKMINATPSMTENEIDTVSPTPENLEIVKTAVYATTSEKKKPQQRKLSLTKNNGGESNNKYICNDVTMEALHNADNCMSQVPVATTNTFNQPTIIEAINANRQSYATLKTNTFFAKKRRRVIDSTNPGVSHPITKRAAKEQRREETISIKNKYNALSEDDSDMEIETIDSDDDREANYAQIEPNAIGQRQNNNSTTAATTNDDSSTNKNNKQEKNPPIIIHSDITNHEQFLEYVQQNVPKAFEIKYTKNNVIVYVSDEKDWSNLNKTLQKDKIEYHTYTHKNQKRTHSY